MIFPHCYYTYRFPTALTSICPQTTSRQLEKSTSIKYFLVDNGSFRAESVLYIRDVAGQLSKVSGKTVEQRDYAFP